MASAAAKAGKKAIKYSGLQKEVFSVYRQIIREAAKKEDPVVRQGIIDLARKQFKDKSKNIRKTDYQTIEHSIRDARKKIKLIQMPGFRGVG